MWRVARLTTVGPPGNVRTSDKGNSHSRRHRMFTKIRAALKSFAARDWHAEDSGEFK